MKYKLIIFALLIVLGGVTYLLTQNIENKPITTAPTLPLAETKPTPPGPQLVDNKQGIQNNEKKILPKEFTSQETDKILVPLFGSPTSPGGGRIPDYPFIKYYDNEIFITIIPTNKGCDVLRLYDRASMSEVRDAFGACGRMLEDTSHLILVSDSGIYTWKVGDRKTNPIKYSSVSENGETYQPISAMGYFPDVVYANGVLTLQVYKKRQNSSKNVGPIRTNTYTIE